MSDEIYKNNLETTLHGKGVSERIYPNGKIINWERFVADILSFYSETIIAAHNAKSQPL